MKYYDQEGNETTLYKLIRNEPEWAQSRIQHSNKRESEMEEEINDLKSVIYNHNQECESLCKPDCIYRTAYTKTKCPDCPKLWIIDDTRALSF